MAAVTSEARVCNLALGLIGQRQYIDRLDEVSTEAQACATYFQSTRDELLQKWHWRFATKRTVLGLTTEVRSGWGFAYAAPSDMLKAQRIWNGNRIPGAGDFIPFAKELNDAASWHLILTDQENAELVYTARLETVALWSPGFVKAVAAQLAVYLAPAVAAKPQLMPQLERGALMAFQMAAALDGNEAEKDTEADSEMIRERG